MTSGVHKVIQLRKSTWDELTRIKYARGFKSHDEVISDLLNDEILEVTGDVE